MVEGPEGSRVEGRHGVEGRPGVEEKYGPFSAHPEWRHFVKSLVGPDV